MMDDSRRRGYLRAVNDLAEERARIVASYEEASQVYARRLEALNKRMTRNVEHMNLLVAGLDREGER